MGKRLFFLAMACAAALCVSPVLYGQATGSFSGTVSDKSGSVITGATVRVTSEGTGLSREAKTDDSGHYLIPLLPAAVFTIHVEFQGFQAIEQKEIRLQVDERRELDFTLTPAAVATSVEVLATEVAVETASPSLGQVITSQEVAQLPLNGRDFVQLATLTSGATAETNPNSFFTGGADSEVAARGSFSLSVGGSRPNSTDWLLDGVDNNELTAGGIGTFSSIDDIQEFKVLTYNYSAQYGTRAGPTVLVTTKSGSNDFHGSLFEFLRNTSLDAKSFFATSAGKIQSQPIWRFHRRTDSQEQDFLLRRWRAKGPAPRHHFHWLGPSAAMHTSAAQPYADFSADAFGKPVSPDLNHQSLYGQLPPFQCSVPWPTPVRPPRSIRRQPGCRSTLRQNTRRFG